MIATIKIKMKSGSLMTVEADGTVYRDSYGSGESFYCCDELDCYWPNSNRKIPDSLYDYDAACAALADKAMHHA